MLGSIAAGKWILHCSYLRDSEREGRFLNVSVFVKYITEHLTCFLFFFLFNKRFLLQNIEI